MKLPDDERILIVRPCLKTICLGIRPAAKLLSLFLFYARNCSEQEAIYTFSCTQDDLIEGLIDEMDVKTLHRTAIPMLRLLGYLDVDGSFYRYQYTVHLDLIQLALAHYRNKEQLEKCLIVSIKRQLEKCLIEIDKSPIELVKCPIELDKLLIPFRQMSNSKRGRKPRPQEAGEAQFSDTQNLTDNTDERERVASATASATLPTFDTHSHMDSTGLQEIAESSLIAPSAIGATNPQGDTDGTDDSHSDTSHFDSCESDVDCTSDCDACQTDNPAYAAEQYPSRDSQQGQEIAPEGDSDHAHPLPSLPAPDHPNGGSSAVPSRHSQVDSNDAPGTLDALPVERAQLREKVGGAGQGGDTQRGGSAGNHADAQRGATDRQRIESETPPSSAVEPGQDVASILPVAPVLPDNTPHDQDRGEAFRLTAVRDTGYTAPAPLPQVLPGVTPPPNTPALTVVPQKGRRGKKVDTSDAPKIVPRCETREIQRRVNEHRGYALEEDVDIIRERKAIKTWCNLHTLEDYEEVMKRLGKDPYWKKPENYYRIGGVTLLKETARVLSDQGQKKVTPANPHGTVSGLPHFEVPPEFRRAMGGK